MKKEQDCISADCTTPGTLVEVEGPPRGSGEGEAGLRAKQSHVGTIVLGRNPYPYKLLRIPT